MLPLRQIFRKISAKLINRLLDYVLGPIPQAAEKTEGVLPKLEAAPARPEPRLAFVAQSAPAAVQNPGEHRNPRSDKRNSRAAAPNATAALPLTTPKKTLRPLDHNIEHEGTVWIPRVLWALAWAELNHEGGKTASDLTRILEEQAGLAVRPNNFARAFRELKTDSRARGLWTAEDKRFTITASGTALLHEIIG